MLLDNYYKVRKQNALTEFAGIIVYNLNSQVKLPNGNLYSLQSAECNGGDHLMCMSPLSHIRTDIPSATANNDSRLKFIVFGDGDTPASINDYSISGNAIDNISCSTISGSVDGDNTRAIYVFKNNNSSPVTIKEVCIFDNYGFYSSGSATSRKFALWREVFETPLTVPAGSIFSYNFVTDYGVGN